MKNMPILPYYVSHFTIICGNWERDGNRWEFSHCKKPGVDATDIQGRHIQSLAWCTPIEVINIECRTCQCAGLGTRVWSCGNGDVARCYLIISTDN